MECDAIDSQSIYPWISISFPSIDGISTAWGRGRAWLRYALIQKSLQSSFVKALHSSKIKFEERQNTFEWVK